MGGSTKTTSNDPWAPAQPYILNSLAQTQQTYDANQPALQADATMEQGAYGQVAPGATAGINDAQAYVNNELTGGNLTNNPYISGIMDTTNRAVTDDVNGQFEASGRYGSGDHTGVLTSKLADADNALQYQNYATERGYQNAAVGQASGLEAGAQSILNNSADLPWVGTAALSGGIRQSSNGYGTSTTTTSDPMGFIGGLAGAGLSAAGSAGGFGALFSDARIKDIDGLAGTTPDGLGLFNYSLKGDPNDTPQTGVLAQDVAQVRPDALGPTAPDGTMSVDYSKLGLPDPSSMAAIFHPDAQSATPFTPGLDLSGGAAPAATDTAPAGAVNATGNPDDTITPQVLPAIKGPSFLDRFMNPDLSTTNGKLTRLGEYMMSMDGSPFKGVGLGLLKGREDDAADAKAEAERQTNALKTRLEIYKAAKPEHGTVGKTAGYYDNAGIFHPTYTAPDDPEKPTDLEKNFKLWQSLPPGPERDRLGLAMTGAQYTPAVLAARIDTAGKVADAQGEARDEHRAPPRASVAPPKYARGPNGQIMKWVP